MNPAVFVDRDNTLIHSAGDLADPEQVRLIQGAASAIASLCGLGYRVVVVTNQDGVARGKYRESDVKAVHQRIRELILSAANGAHVERFYYCPYHPRGAVERYAQEHPNRKPAPGMLQQAARELDLNLSQSWMIGDHMRDIQAGVAAGTRTILVRPKVDELTRRDFREPAARTDPDQPPRPDVMPDFLARNLVEAVRIIAQQRKPDAGEDARRHTAGKRWDAAAVARVQQPPPGESTSRRPAADTARPAAKPAAKPELPARPSSTPPRPFRPWDAPQPKAESDQPVTSEPPPSTPNPSAHHPTPTPTPPPHPTHPQPASNPPAAAQPGTASPRQAPPPKTAAAPLAAEPPPAAPASEKTMRLLLQELRHQRGRHTEFSYLTVLAIVLQTVAAVCLLGALWMGAHDSPIFFRWLGAGLMVQLATIAMLLFARA